MIVVVWLVIGLVVGVIASFAELRLPLTGGKGWLLVIIEAVTAALVGGWLGSLVLSRYYSPATALWVAILIVTIANLLPRVIRRSA
ncbi:MAG TPA: hypothetical protein VKU87_04720 [Thermomicrobiaceae bacterium]|nr:hypothetical protein [Thermomicrobiaceae bacterium]